MFSNTTMASSQTRPIDNTIATRVSTLIENPATYMMKKPAMMLTGMAITGMIVDRQSRRKPKMINATSAKAMINVSLTSLTLLRTNRVKS